MVFVNRYFAPDHSATSQMVSDLAIHLASRGWSVLAITSRQRYDDPRAALPSRESLDGVAVRRVWSSTFGRGSLAGRAIDYATFYLSALFALTSAARRGTVVVALTDPPLISVIAAVAARLRGAILVSWLHDLFPEVATALGMRVPAVLQSLRDWSLRRARMNVVLGERMAARARATTAAVTVRHNWADASLAPLPHADNRLRAEWRLGDALVAGYSGNLGRAHEFDTIAGAMQQLRGDESVKFVVIGSGAQLERLRAAAPPNALFLPYQPRERLRESLSAADVHLVTLQPSVEGLIVPSKLYGILASGRAVIFIGDPDGEVADVIRRHECGAVVAPGDAAALADALRELAADRARVRDLGCRARRAYESEFHRDLALQSWERILEEAAA